MVLPSCDKDDKIDSPWERYLLISYLLIVLLSSLIGDTIILIASVRYNAMKLNKFIVAVMQHIAVSDILVSITYVLPTMISLIANQWILGDVIAYIQVYLDGHSFTASNILMCALMCSKLLLLEYPLQTKLYMSTKNAHFTCACIWSLSALIPAVRFGLDKGGLIFSFIDYNINYGVPSKYSNTDRIVLNTMSVLVLDIPALVVIVTTCFTVVHLFRSREVAKRSGGEQRWQGIVTVVATATVYCISVIPYRVTFMIFDIVMTQQVPYQIDLTRYFEYLGTLNIVCKFFIYVLVVPSFREFVRLRVFQLLARIVRCTVFGGQLQARN